jgi:c(7)-type cytochrome triheme protein
MTRNRLAWFLVLAVLWPGSILAQGTSGKKRRPLPPEFGRVVLDKQSAGAGMAPVVFDHWLHRAKYTCRLCHVDVGFAMTANGTGIRAADNAAGHYCGACHDGKRVADGRKIFESCGKGQPSDPKSSCTRCHSVGKNVKPAYDFDAFVKPLPRGRFGNGVDWENVSSATQRRRDGEASATRQRRVGDASAIRRRRVVVSPAPKWGTPPQNVHSDWLVNVTRWSFGSNKQIVANIKDFHGVPHPTP